MNHPSRRGGTQDKHQEIAMTLNRISHSDSLGRLVGTWTTEATHPKRPGVVVHGIAAFEWLEGQRFLVHRARTDHRDFPDSLSVIGRMGQDRVHGDAGSVQMDGDETPLRMHYFDSRGVFRVYDVSMDDAEWRWWRNVPGFSQRFVGLISADGNTINGRSQLCEDDVHWADDLQITYRRRT
jgi:hypothetical protein